MSESFSATIPTLRKELMSLNRLDPDTTPFEDFLSAYKNSCSGLNVVVGLTTGAELFFRVRKNPISKPTNIRELSAPPANLITGFQRCNAPGKPMLYTSSKRITALKECRIKPGDIVYISQWIGNGKLPVNKIINDGDSKWMDHITDPISNIIHAHIDSVFTRRIHSDFSNDYKQSAAISTILTAGFRPNAQHDVREDRTIGFRYPSIFDRQGSYNTVFHDGFACERLKLLHCMECLIEDNDGSQMPMSVLDTAFEFEGGEINWTGSPTFVPKMRPMNRSVQFIFSGKKWLLEVRRDEASDSSLQHLLFE